MHHMLKTNKRILAAAIACILPISASHASGFRVPELTVTGTSTSNALVANTDELGAIAYNPASNAFHDGKHILAGINGISYETTVRPTNGSTTTGQGKDFFEIPNLLLSVNGEGKTGFALLVNAPFGLETNWPDETFPNFVPVVVSNGPPPVTLDNLEPELSRIKMLNYNPNFSYKLDDNTSMAVGIDFYDVIDLSFNTQAIKINGTGDGVGYNLAFMHKMGKLNMGISYRSAVSTSIKGYMDTTAIGGSIIAVDAKLKFPSILQIGFNYQITDNFGVEFDIDQTGWKSFDTILIRDTTGTARSSSTNNWKNSNAYRLGFHYDLSSSTRLLFGYTYDETPQPDATFSARVPDADRQLFSIGVRYKVGDFTVEGAYMHVDVDERTHNSNASFAGEANGTALYNGTYESKVSLIGFSLGMKF